MGLYGFENVTVTIDNLEIENLNDPQIFDEVIGRVSKLRVGDSAEVQVCLNDVNAMKIAPNLFNVRILVDETAIDDPMTFNFYIDIPRSMSHTPQLRSPVLKIYHYMLLCDSSVGKTTLLRRFTNQ